MTFSDYFKFSLQLYGVELMCVIIFHEKLHYFDSKLLRELILFIVYYTDAGWEFLNFFLQIVAILL